MDRVSNLPDEVLCHILSFLRTKEAALTSVLSKRWRDLLAFVSNLNLDDSVFLHPEEGKRERDGILQSFMDFVDRILALQGDSPIKKFYLKCETGVGSDCVDRWVSKVLKRGVSELGLCINFEDGYRLPPEIFVSRTLVLLKVVCLSDLDWQTLGISLPMLETLFIRGVGFSVDQFEMLLPACPLLEILNMEDFKWMNSNVTVSSARLKVLIIHSNGCSDLINPVSISFDTPSVDYFDYSDFVAEDYPKVNLTNLVTARINLKLTEDQIERARAPNIDGLEDDVFLRFGNVRKFFSGIKHAQQLHLYSDTLELLSLCCESMPVFNNLKGLRIRSEIDRGWQAMPVLLKNCPHLELLVFDGLLHHVTDKCGDACDCVSRESKGRSLINCPVKKLQIIRFRATGRELEMVKHFLKSFPCLMEVEIFVEKDDPTVLEDPLLFELVAGALRLYGKLYNCDVELLAAVSMYKKLFPE